MMPLQHNRILSQPDMQTDNAQQHTNTFRTIKPAQFLNNINIKETEPTYQTPQYNQKTYEPQTERVGEFQIHLPRINQNSSKIKPLVLMPESKHNQLKSQLENIFLQSNTNSESHIVLPGLHRKRKESHLCFKMIEEQLSYQNPQTIVSENRFRKRRNKEAQSQTNLETISQIETENSQIDEQNKERKVEFYQRVKVINLQNGRVATEVIKEEETEQLPVKPKRKFVSQKTRFIPDIQK